MLIHPYQLLLIGGEDGVAEFAALYLSKELTFNDAAVRAITTPTAIKDTGDRKAFSRTRILRSHPASPPHRRLLVTSKVVLSRWNLFSMLVSQVTYTVCGADFQFKLFLKELVSPLGLSNDG